MGQAGPLGPAGVRRYTGEEVNKRTKDSHPLVSAEKDQKLGAASIAVAGEGPWGDWSGRPCRRGASPEQAWLASGTLDLGGFVPFPDRSSHDVETVAQTLWFVQNCSLRAGAWSCGVCQAEELSSKSPGHRGSGWVVGGLPGDSTSHAVPARRRWGIRRTSCDSAGRGGGSLGSLDPVPSLGGCALSPWNNSRLRARLF